MRYSESQVRLQFGAAEILTRHFDFTNPRFPSVL
jgi:hypothetical protein